MTKRTQLHPAPAMTPSDRAAHDKASYVRPFLSPVGTAALARLEARTGGWFPEANPGDHPSQEDEALRRVREHRDALREGLAAAREYAESAAA